jgi:prevent-host-death family protein
MRSGVPGCMPGQVQSSELTRWRSSDGAQTHRRLTSLGQAADNVLVTVQVNVYQAKTQLSRLLDQVSAGEDVVIARAGRPVARLIAYSGPTSPRQPGAWRGRVQIAEDFDLLPADLQAAFAGDAQ